MKIQRLEVQNKRLEDKSRFTKSCNTQKQTRRKHIRKIPESMIQSDMKIIDQLNLIGKFSYLDQNRNQGAINLFKTQVNQLISNYGCDLQYFRKYNTFFKDDDENSSNLVYGQDTTAQFYASGLIRSFVQVENMAWNFNQLGMENTQQVTIFIGIQNFSQLFSTKIAKIKTDYFQIPVNGNIVHNEVVGKINAQQFDAEVYGIIDQKLKVKTSNIKIIPKTINNSFYVSHNYDTSLYQISGFLEGKMKMDDCYPTICSGVLKGQLSYYSYQNKEDSSSWNLAPQVGDYFKFVTNSGIDQEWQITQVFDRLLMNKSGINPLLGKYIYQCSAVKRVASHQQNDLYLDQRQPGDNIDQIFHPISKSSNKYADQYQVDPITKQNKLNKKTNRIAKNTFNYQKNEDLTYGGYQNKPNAK